MALSFPMHNLCSSNGLNHATNALCIPAQQDVLRELYSEEYGPQILSRFSEFRQEGLFCDFSLMVEDEEFMVSNRFLNGLKKQSVSDFSNSVFCVL